MNGVEIAQSWVLGTAGVVSLGVGAGRAVAYRQRAEPTRAYLAIGLGAIGVALLLNVAPLAELLDHVAGATNLSVVASQVLALVDAWAAIEMVAASIGRVSMTARLLRGAGLMVASAALVIGFRDAGSWPERPVVTFFVETSQVPGWRSYWLMYACISLLPSLYLAFSSLRHAASAAPWLRAGLRVVGIGSLLCAAFSVLLAIALVRPTGLVLGLTQMVVVALGSAFVAIGVGLPHVPDIRNRYRLRPMWSALTAFYPEVRASSRPDLRRLVTEIQDAVVVARARDELASPLICAVADLPGRGADAFDETVADLISVAELDLSAEWDTDVWASREVANQ